MHCHVLLFAQLRDAIGRERLTLDLPHGASVCDALDSLSSSYAAIAAMRGQIAVAVDEKYQPMRARLADGCTIALIPPVSGG